MKANEVVKQSIIDSGNDKLIKTLTLAVVLLLVVFVVLIGLLIFFKRGPENISRIEREIKALQEQIQRDPNGTNLRLDLGWRLYQKGDHSAALSQYEEIMRLNPDHVGALYGRALALESLGRPGDAIESLKGVVAKDNLHDQGYFELAKLYWQQGSLEEALASIERNLELQPISSSAHYLKGRILLSKEDADSAMSEFKIALDYDPEYALGYLGSGLVYAKKGSAEEAQENLKKAIALDPKLDEAVRALRELTDNK